jgi:hypothetical protein
MSMRSIAHKYSFGACRNSNFTLLRVRIARQGARIHSERPQIQISYGNQKPRASARRRECGVRMLGFIPSIRKCKSPTATKNRGHLPAAASAASNSPRSGEFPQGGFADRGC